MAKWNSFVGFSFSFSFFYWPSAPARLPSLHYVSTHTWFSSRRYNFTLNYLTVAASAQRIRYTLKWQVNNKRGCSLVTGGRASPLIDPQTRLQPINNEDSVSPRGAVTSCARALHVCCVADRSGFATQPKDLAFHAARYTVFRLKNKRWLNWDFGF